MKKRVPVEQLLEWAYREELPKCSNTLTLQDISPMFRLADLGTRIDEWSVDPGFPAALGPPHADALMIDAAVGTLPEIGLDWAASRARLMPDLMSWADENDPVLSAMSFQPAGLITLHARMGTRPIWDLGPARAVRIIGRNGKPVIQHINDEGELVEGRTDSRNYGPFSRCPLRLEPSPREIACARAEYSVWHSSLRALTTMLYAWTMQDHHALPPRAAPEPWIVDDESKSRILPSIRSMRMLV